MKRIYSIILTILCLSTVMALAQKAVTKPPSVPKAEAESLSLKVQRIELGPEGIIIRDSKGKILKIQNPHDIQLEEIDCILKATGKSRIEIEELRRDIESFHDSLMAEFPWEEGEEGNVDKCGQSIFIAANEIVEGDAVAIGGSITVDGVVKGSAVAIGGGVTVTNRGQVGGDGGALG